MALIYILFAFPSYRVSSTMVSCFLSTLLGDILLDSCTHSLYYVPLILRPINLIFFKPWDLAYFCQTNLTFFFFDKTYNVPHVLLPKDIFNETAYTFIPLYLSTMYAMTYLRKRILNDVEK